MKRIILAAALLLLMSGISSAEAGVSENKIIPGMDVSTAELETFETEGVDISTAELEALGLETLKLEDIHISPEELEAFKFNVELISKGDHVTFKGEKNKWGACLPEKSMFCLVKEDQYVCRDIFFSDTDFIFELNGLKEVRLPLEAIGHSNDLTKYPVKKYTLVSCDK